MEIKKGYKMTDVGVIPEDWEIKSIGELFSFKNGLNKDKDSFGFGTPIINYMDVYKNNGLTSKDIKGKVSLNDFEINCFLVKKGDVFFTRTSETPEEVGLTSVLLEDIPYGVFSGFLLRARPKDNILDPFLCKYLFSNESFRSSVIQNSTYTTRALTNGNILSSLFIAFPNNKHEQQSIADALTKVDNLIMSLSKVIEKKKLIKKGTMQKLLSGEVRLDGFEGEWVNMALGLIFIIQKGVQINNENLMSNGKYYYLNGGIIPSGYTDYYNTNGNTISISEGGNSCGFVCYNKNKYWSGGHCYSLIPKIDINVEFIYEQLKFHENEIMDLRVGSGIPNIQVGALCNFEITFPNSIDEQTAIANVLTTMDDEIEKLEKERDKYKSIKQGMMQQLLTGKIRLVCQ